LLADLTGVEYGYVLREGRDSAHGYRGEAVRLLRPNTDMAPGDAIAGVRLHPDEPRSTPAFGIRVVE
jgi:hypothetical protein